MPRRSTRVAAPTEDDIEVDEQENLPSQHDSVQDADQAMESADEVPEQKPVRRSKKANATKSRSKTATVKAEKCRKLRTRRNATDDEGASENGADAPHFDRDEFLATARPIPQDGARSIEGVVSDLQRVIVQLESNGFDLVSDTAVAIEEVSGNTDEGQEAATELDMVMRQLVDAQEGLKAHQQSLDSIKQRILRGEVMGNLEELYNTSVSDRMEAYSSRTARQKYSKHKGYFKFREHVWEVNHDDAMPPIGDIIPREDGDSEADSDIEVGGMTQDYKCPITLRPLTDPLTSKLCGHSFDAAAIREYITVGRGRTECAATGCKKVLALSDLETNEDLAKRATNAVRRAKRKEDDSDDSEAEVVD